MLENNLMLPPCPDGETLLSSEHRRPRELAARAGAAAGEGLDRAPQETVDWRSALGRGVPTKPRRWEDPGTQGGSVSSGRDEHAGTSRSFR